MALQSKEGRFGVGITVFITVWATLTGDINCSDCKQVPSEHYKSGKGTFTRCSSLEDKHELSSKGRSTSCLLTFVHFETKQNNRT